jgi:hypothetical protein
MAKDRSLVRASDLGAWAFCRRAWWLREVKHAQHEDPSVLAQGTVAHKAHGRQVQGARRLTRVGLLLIGTGLAAIGLLIIWHMIG